MTVAKTLRELCHMPVCQSRNPLISNRHFTKIKKLARKLHNCYSLFESITRVKQINLLLSVL